MAVFCLRIPGILCGHATERRHVEARQPRHRADTSIDAAVLHDALHTSVA